jgi:hypothetical protein
MKPFHLGPIDKALAHKVRDENVFVRDLRRAIPGTLSTQTVEELVLPKLSEVDRKFFLSYYQISEAPADDRRYVLFDLPHELPERLFDHHHADSLNAEEEQLVRQYYTPQSGVFRLIPSITEESVAALGPIFDQRGLSLSERDRTSLANLLESVPDLPLEEVYHGVLRMDPTHTFFFEHPNEHVPGMMIIEASRQFGMACCHVFGQIPLRGHQFIMRELHVRFLDYVNLNYPATFKAELKSLTKRRSEWHEVNMQISVIQQGSVCVEMEFPAQFVSKRSFQRLRADRHQTDPLHRFQPIANIRHEIVLWNPVEQKYHKAKLWDISMEGFRVEMAETLDENGGTELWETVLYFEDLGFIRSACTPIWRRKERELNWVGFHFHAMSKEDRDLLQTAIRQYCHVRREREHL